MKTDSRFAYTERRTGSDPDYWRANPLAASRRAPGLRRRKGLAADIMRFIRSLLWF